MRAEGWSEAHQTIAQSIQGAGSRLLLTWKYIIMLLEITEVQQGAG